MEQINGANPQPNGADSLPELPPGEQETRPWGKWKNVHEGPGYRVKKLIVEPGHRMSLQYHNHRSEHWVVVNGRARAIIGKDTLDLGVLQSAHVPRRTIHRIENPFDEPVIIIEVQEGKLLLEEDIVRIQDDYQRVGIAKELAS